MRIRALIINASLTLLLLRSAHLAEAGGPWPGGPLPNLPSWVGWDIIIILIVLLIICWRMCRRR